MHHWTLAVVELHRPVIAPPPYRVNVALKARCVLGITDNSEKLAVVRVKLTCVLDNVRKIVDEDDEEKWLQSSALKNAGEDVQPVG